MVIGNRRRIPRVLITPASAPHISTVRAAASLITGDDIVIVVIVVAIADKVHVKAHLLHLLWGQYPYAPHTVHELPVYNIILKQPLLH